MSTTYPIASAALQYDLDGERKTVFLDRPTMTIGRSTDCDICLPNRMVSRRHATVMLVGEDWWIEDQKSTGGTFVNSRRVDRQQLRNGDKIKLGDVELRFSMMDSDLGSTVANSMPMSKPEPASPSPQQLPGRPPSHFPGEPMCGPPHSRSPGDLAELKQAVHAKLVENLDLSKLAEVDPDTARDELRQAAEHFCTAEDARLSASDRNKLVEEILQESLGVRSPDSARNNSGAKQADPVDAVHRKLIAAADFSLVGGMDADVLRAELRSCAEELCAKEYPLLEPSRRAAIVDAVISKTFGKTAPHSTGQDSQPVVADPAPATHRGSADAEAIEKKDTVDCTVFAPPTAMREEQFLVQVFVHIPEEAEAAACDAREFDEDAGRRGATSLGTEIVRGSTLTFELTMRDTVIDEPVRDIVWRGRRASVQFGVEVPAGCTRPNLLGTVTVSQNSIPIGTVTFKLKLATSGTPSSATPVPTGEAHRYTQAFISYASRDRSEVIRRVQMLKTVGISFFQDVLDLEPGERWAQRLYERIDHSDVLFLFWSTAAKESEWVAKEWQYALEKKGDTFVRPVGIEGPPIPEPPAELAHLHFGDPLLYFIR